MHDAFSRILFYGESIFSTGTFRKRISDKLKSYSVFFKDGSFDMEQSFLKPFDLIMLEYSPECDHLNTFFKLYPSDPIILILPQGSENLLQKALAYPITNFVIADPEGHFINLLESLIRDTLNHHISKGRLSKRRLAAEAKQNLEREQSHMDFKQLYSLLRTMTDTVPDMIWAKDLESRFIFANASICKNLLNASSTLEPLNKQLMYFVERERTAHPDNPNWFTFGEACSDSDAVTLEKKELCRFTESGNVFGTNLILDVYKAPIHDENGEIIGTVGSARNITDHEEAKERYRKLFEYSPDPVVVHINGTIIAANQAAADFIGAKRREDYYGQNVFDFIHPDYRQQSLDRIKEAEYSDRPNVLIEEKYITLDGSIRDVEAVSVPISYGNRKAWMATFRDISERKRAEEKINQSLDEKNALLNEIHHRTRNNMQVVTSIINIRAKELTDPTSIQMLKEISDRISAMSLVHDQLYESHDLSAIDFGAYLTNLARFLSLSYPEISARAPITIHASHVIVSIDYAVPLGLVINEILTNAYKYAFPDQQKGHIELHLESTSSGGLILTVSDNGIGLPTDAFNDSLSTIILTTLIEEQLGGRLEYKTDQGTQFKVHIPIVAVKPRI